MSLVDNGGEHAVVGDERAGGGPAIASPTPLRPSVIQAEHMVQSLATGPIYDDPALSAEILMRVPGRYLGEYDRDGFLNAYQTGGTGGGMPNPFFRYFTELNMTGGKLTRAPWNLFPKYAYANLRGRAGNVQELPFLLHYGHVVVVFRPEVVKRATYNVGDSLFTKAAIPPLTDERSLQGELLEQPHYFEVQIYGDLTLDDASALLIPEGEDPAQTQSALSLAKKYGLEVYEYREAGIFNESSPLMRRLVYAPKTPKVGPAFHQAEGKALVAEIGFTPVERMPSLIDRLSRSGLPNAADLIARMADEGPGRDERHVLLAAAQSLSLLGDVRALSMAVRIGDHDIVQFLGDHFDPTRVDRAELEKVAFGPNAGSNDIVQGILARRLVKEPDPRLDWLETRLRESQNPRIKVVFENAAKPPPAPLFKPVKAALEVELDEALAKTGDISTDVKAIVEGHPNAAALNHTGRLVEALRRPTTSGWDDYLLGLASRNPTNKNSSVERQAATEALGLRSTPASQTSLIALLANKESDDAVHAIAFGALLARGTPEAQAAVENDFLKGGRDRFTQVWEFDQLIRHGSPSPAVLEHAERLEQESPDEGLHVLLGRARAEARRRKAS